jgi:membrane associated rhomboid family serine protease
MVEIFRSPKKKAANEHALVLSARGLAHQVVFLEGNFRLLVPSLQAGAARAELFHYETENEGWPPREVPPPMRSRGLAAALAYALLLLVVYPMGRTGFLGVDLLREGAMDAARVRDGELWRAVTALTLHGDLAHIAGNLCFGALFAILAAHQLGAGLAWAAILAAGALGNLLNALVQRAGFVSIGASTASFAALGLLATYEWVRRATLRQRPLRRLAPLLGAAALLGYLGMGGSPSEFSSDIAVRSRTDVIAHMAGFGMGALFGFALGRSRLPELAQPRHQRGLGLFVLGSVALAWWIAVSRA